MGRRLLQADGNDEVRKALNSRAGMVTNLTFLRRPTIGFGTRAAHQHRSLAVAQAASLEKGLDGLLVVDDGVRSCPFRTPQAAVEPPGIQHAGTLSRA